jgi:hypothetical protein
MGWSLQAPVSGLAAWVMVNSSVLPRGRPRDLPAWGLIGDVTQMGMMYTVLNQVGGTVGSEGRRAERADPQRAMLFSNVVINFTPSTRRRSCWTRSSPGSPTTPIGTWPSVLLEGGARGHRRHHRTDSPRAVYPLGHV